MITIIIIIFRYFLIYYSGLWYANKISSQNVVRISTAQYHII
jgi:hypothetical protein